MLQDSQSHFSETTWGIDSPDMSMDSPARLQMRYNKARQEFRQLLQRANEMVRITKRQSERIALLIEHNWDTDLVDEELSKRDNLEYQIWGSLNPD